jgi:hypothetical protein
MNDRKLAQPLLPYSPVLRRGGRPRRRGIAIAWLIIWSVVFLLMLCFAVEIGSIYVAQSELETALEAAALAGVKEWHDSGSTVLARDYAVAYAHANTVNDVPVLLDRNDSPPPLDANGNYRCDGELVLGRITGTTCNDLEFDHGQSPGGGGETVTLTVRVGTGNGNDIFTEVGQGIRPFTVLFVGASNPNLVVTSVLFNVSTAPESNPGPGGSYFDLRPKTGGGKGLGPDNQNGLPPIFSAPWGTGTPSYPGATSTTYRVNFTGNNFTPGQQFSFGVDTDYVGLDGVPPYPNKQQRYADRGGSLAGTTVTISFFNTVTLTASSLSGQLVVEAIPPAPYDSSSVLQFVDQPLPSGSYGVHTEKRWQVPSICHQVFPLLPLGPYKLHAAATAMYEPGGSPKLVRITRFLSCP